MEVGASARMMGKDIRSGGGKAVQIRSARVLVAWRVAFSAHRLSTARRTARIEKKTGPIVRRQASASQKLAVVKG